MLRHTGQIPAPTGIPVLPQFEHVTDMQEFYVMFEQSDWAVLGAKKST